jgi:hypothetical protein
MADKIVAILPTRNSAWILGLSVRVLLMWCDEVNVCLHTADHDTATILGEMAEQTDRVKWFLESDPVWREMDMRQRLLGLARKRGATHIVTIDDDEVVSGNLLPTIRQTVLDMPKGRILQLPWLQLRGGIDRVITTGMWAQQSASCAFVDSPELHWAVQAGGYDHHHRHPMGMAYRPYEAYPANIPGFWRSSGCLHLQMCSRERLLWKHIWYACVEKTRWPEKSTAAIDAMYTRTVNECYAAQTTACPEEWWDPYKHLMRHLDLDAEPWQKAEVYRMLGENPRLLDGLTTYGLL